MTKLATVLTTALIAAAGANASTVLNENFDELTPAFGVTSAGAFTAIDGTNVDIVGAANGFAGLCAAPASGNCIDLDGTGGNSQGILESGPITLEAGIDYYLSFDLLGSGRGNTTSTTVTFGSYDQTFTLASSDTTTGMIINVLVTTPITTDTNLVFTSNTPGDTGSVLDNVLITASPSTSAPEPSTATFMIPALLGLIAIGRRRFPRFRTERAAVE